MRSSGDRALVSVDESDSCDLERFRIDPPFTAWVTRRDMNMLINGETLLPSTGFVSSAGEGIVTLLSTDFVSLSLVVFSVGGVTSFAIAFGNFFSMDSFAFAARPNFNIL